MLDLNDEAVVAVAGARVEGWVRLALQEDFAEAVLSKALGRCARAHPAVRIEARIARNSKILEHLSVGQLDLALVWSSSMSEADTRDTRVAKIPMTWIGLASPVPLPASEPVPLVVVEAPCIFRAAAIAALDAAAIKWRVAFTSTSLAGVWAATAAGLGITLRSPVGLPPSVVPLATGALPDANRLVAIRLLSADAVGKTPAVALLADIIATAVREEALIR